MGYNEYLWVSKIQDRGWKTQNNIQKMREQNETGTAQDIAH